MNIIKYGSHNLYQDVVSTSGISFAVNPFFAQKGKIIAIATIAMSLLAVLALIFRSFFYLKPIEARKAVAASSRGAGTEEISKTFNARVTLSPPIPAVVESIKAGAETEYKRVEAAETKREKIDSHLSDPAPLVPDEDDRTVLKDIEDQIVALKDKIQQNQKLAPESLGNSECQQQSSLEFGRLLSKYPSILSSFLADQFSGIFTKDVGAVSRHLAFLADLLRIRQTDSEFICACLVHIDQFLDTAVFTGIERYRVHYEHQQKLIDLQTLFPIIDQYFSFIEKENPAVALQLKIKFANLPLGETVERSQFKNLFLSEQEQLKVMIDHFQHMEDETIHDILPQYLNARQMTLEDCTWVAKLADTSKTRMSVLNQQKLHVGLEKWIGVQQPAFWSNEKLIRQRLLIYYQSLKFSYDSSHWDQSFGEKIKKIYKAKKYLSKYSQIPRWYHATQVGNVDKIVASGLIQVTSRWDKMRAFVSSQREDIYGQHVFVFNHSITRIDDRPVDSDRFYKWRGLDKPIPFVSSTEGAGSEQGSSHLVLIGLPRPINKAVKGQYKTTLKRHGVSNPKILPTDVVDFLQKEIVKVIGMPNRSFYW